MSALPRSECGAYGQDRLLGDAGRAVPDDVAVVGFDDVPVALGARPALTTVRQPIEAMGRAMAEVLVRAVAGDADGPPSVVLPTTLVRRSSA